MEPLVIGIVVVVAAVIGWMLWQPERTGALPTRYADRYDRTSSDLGRHRGEAESVTRETGVRQFKVLSLSATERVRYLAEWRRVQEQFVDDPTGAVLRGNELVEEVLRGRGYPVARNFDHHVADLSIDHPRVAQNYRLEREIVARQRGGSASGEDLHHAMILYRELVEDLLGDTPTDIRTERVVHRPVERDMGVKERVKERAEVDRRRFIGDEARP